MMKYDELWQKIMEYDEIWRWWAQDQVLHLPGGESEKNLYLLEGLEKFFM